MTAESLVARIRALSPDQQAAVLEFISSLERENDAVFRAADEFIIEHSALLTRLAQ